MAIATSTLALGLAAATAGATALSAHKQKKAADKLKSPDSSVKAPDIRDAEDKAKRDVRRRRTPTVLSSESSRNAPVSTTKKTLLGE